MARKTEKNPEVNPQNEETIVNPEENEVLSGQEKQPEEKKEEPEVPEVPEVKVAKSTPKTVKIRTTEPINCLVAGVPYNFAANNEVAVPADVAAILTNAQKASESPSYKRVMIPKFLICSSLNLR